MKDEKYDFVWFIGEYLPSSVADVIIEDQTVNYIKQTEEQLRTTEYLKDMVKCLNENPDYEIDYHRFLEATKSIHDQQINNQQKPSPCPEAQISSIRILHILLKNTTFRRNGGGSIIKLLTLICAKSSWFTGVLLEDHVEETIRYLLTKREFSGIEDRIALVKFIWALLPNYDFTSVQEEECFMQEDIKIWSREINRENGVWSKFNLKQNTQIDKASKSKHYEFTMILDDALSTVNLEKKIIFIESTAESRSIAVSTEEYSGFEVYKNKFIKQHKYTENFMNLTFKFLVKTFNDTTVNCEKIFCLKGILCIFEYVDQGQCSLIRKGLVKSQIEKMLQCLVIYQYDRTTLHYLEAVATRILGLLSESQDTYYRSIILGWKAYYDKYLERVPEVDSTPISLKKQIAELQDHKKLEACRNALMESNSKYSSRKTTLASVYSYLTQPEELEEKLRKVRVFLNVFADIPEEPESDEIKVNAEPLRKLLSTAHSILDDASTPCEYMTGAERIHYGIRTIGQLNYRNFKMRFQTILGFKYFSVNCLMTIEHLQQYVYMDLFNQQSYNGFRPVEQFHNTCSFEFEGELVPPEITLLEAINRWAYKVKYPGFIFQLTYTFICKIRSKATELPYEAQEKIEGLEYYLRDRPSAEKFDYDMQKALIIADILYGINENWRSAYDSIENKVQYILDPKEFIHIRLDRILENVMMNPLKIYLGKLPSWVTWIFDNSPFTFPFETRKYALKVLFLNRRNALREVLKRYKNILDVEVTVNTTTTPRFGRDTLLQDLEMFTRETRPDMAWKVKFKDETGEGEGVKRELFTEVGRQLQLPKYSIWSSGNDLDSNSEGLYPSVAGNEEMSQERLITVGMLMAKAILEDSVMDLPLAPPFFSWFNEELHHLNLDDLKYVNKSVHKVLKSMEELVTKRDNIINDPVISDEERKKLVQALEIDGCSIESYDLYFVLPGYDNIELISNGANEKVTIYNVDRYIHLVKDYFLLSGVSEKMMAIKLGFSYVMSLRLTRKFRPPELGAMVCGCNDDDYWTVDHMKKYIQLKKYTWNDSIVCDMIDIISSANSRDRQHFLKFVTSSSRLPLGGFKSLNPRFTIERVEDGNPSAHTCFNLLQLPRSYTKDMLQHFFIHAITYGMNHFDFI